MTVWAKGARFSPMALSLSLSRVSQWRPGPAATLLGGLGIALAVALAAIGPGRLIAQVEGQRGIQPLASTADIQISARHIRRIVTVQAITGFFFNLFVLALTVNVLAGG